MTDPTLIVGWQAWRWTRSPYHAKQAVYFPPSGTSFSFPPRASNFLTDLVSYSGLATTRMVLGNVPYSCTYVPYADIPGVDVDFRSVELWALGTNPWAEDVDDDFDVMLAEWQFTAGQGADAGDEVTLGMTDPEDVPQFDGSNYAIALRSVSNGAGARDVGGSWSVLY